MGTLGWTWNPDALTGIMLDWNHGLSAVMLPSLLAVQENLMSWLESWTVCQLSYGPHCDLLLFSENWNKITSVHKTQSAITVHVQVDIWNLTCNKSCLLDNDLTRPSCSQAWCSQHTAPLPSFLRNKEDGHTHSIKQKQKETSETWIGDNNLTL